MVIRLVLLLVFTVVQAHAESWFSPFCEDDCSSPTCNQLQSTGVESVLPKELLAYNEIVSGANDIQQSIQAQVDQWGDFTRWLKGDQTKGSPAGFDQRWRDLQDEANALLEIHEQLNINKRRLDICYRGQCSAYRRVELEKERDDLNRLKIQMTTLSPWWVTEEFITLTEKDNPRDTTEAELRQAMIASMTNFFQQSFDLSAQLSSIKADVNLVMEGKIPSTMLLTNSALRNNEGFDLILRRRMLNNPTHPNPLCDIAAAKENIDTARNFAAGAFKGGLLLSSLLVGPESLLLSSAAKTAARSGVFSRLINFFSSGPRTLAYGADAVLTASVVNDRLKKGEECQQVQALNQLGDETQDRLKECLRERDHATLYASLAALSTTSTFALPLLRNLINARTATRPPAITTRPSEQGNTLATLDLTRGREIASSDLAELSGKYWDFVGDVYRQRLNLSQDEIANFVASSKAFEDRTKLVVMTRGPPAQHKFEGGAAIVESRRSTDLLPLEKATGVSLPRNEGKIAEIVRLTSVSENNPNLMKDVLSEIAAVVKADPEVKTLYVYTSKVHARLYRRLGIPYKQVGNPIERDVIIEIKASDFAQLTP